MEKKGFIWSYYTRWVATANNANMRLAQVHNYKPSFSFKHNTGSWKKKSSASPGFFLAQRAIYFIHQIILQPQLLLYNLDNPD